MLDAPRAQLERISSRLAQTAGLESLELAAEIVAFSYVAAGAALEAALKEAIDAALQHLRQAARPTLSPIQTAAVSEASFESFTTAERVRGRHDVQRAMTLRVHLVAELRGDTLRDAAPSVIQMTGVPHADHFQLFFRLATDGEDPRGVVASPPLARLVGRVRQVRGPRNDFAHDCADPTQHQLVIGRSLELTGLPDVVEGLQVALVELQILLDVLEQSCDVLAQKLIAPPDEAQPPSSV